MVPLFFSCSYIPSPASDFGPTPSSSDSKKFQRELLSWKTIRETNVVMQANDFSCGSAAMATLMRFYFADTRTEREVLNNILNALTPEEIQIRGEKGLTMLDLKRCAERLGYQAAGVELTVPVLMTLGGPIIVHLVKNDYKHFAVLRGIRDDRVYLTDPSRGNITLRTWKFTEEWTGYALILGKRGFGMPKDHGLSVRGNLPVQDYGISIGRARSIGYQQ